jgi:hypothetical protein
MQYIYIVYNIYIVYKYIYNNKYEQILLSILSSTIKHLLTKKFAFIPRNNINHQISSS